MGTNFYWLEPPPRCPHCDKEIGKPTEGKHIGKRSAAGLYCYDCDETLIKGGKAAIHKSSSGHYDACPKCGAKPVKQDGFKRGPVAVELGFAKPEEDRPRGVTGAASFSWASDPSEARQVCEDGENIDTPVIVDEYGRTLTGGEFLRMLRANCPIEFTDMIGRSFS